MSCLVCILWCRCCHCGPLWAQNLSGGWVGGERGGRVLKWNSLISRLIRLWMRMQQLNRKEINGAKISTNLLQP